VNRGHVVRMELGAKSSKPMFAMSLGEI